MAALHAQINQKTHSPQPDNTPPEPPLLTLSRFRPHISVSLISYGPPAVLFRFHAFLDVNPLHHLPQFAPDVFEFTVVIFLIELVELL